MDRLQMIETICLHWEGKNGQQVFFMTPHPWVSPLKLALSNTFGCTCSNSVILNSWCILKPNPFPFDLSLFFHSFTSSYFNPSYFDFPTIVLILASPNLNTDLLTRSSLPLVRHRASTIALHLFFTIFSASLHVFLMFSSSFITVCLHDCFGLPCFPLPWGFKVMAILRCSLSLSFLKVWPIYFHFLHLIVIATSSCPVLAHSSSFMSIWQSLLFTNICTLESRALVRRQVFDPWRSTDLTLQLSILNLVLRERALALQTALRHAKPCYAFLIHAVISSSVPSVTFTMLPR